MAELCEQSRALLETGARVVAIEKDSRFQKGQEAIILEFAYLKHS